MSFDPDGPGLADFMPKTETGNVALLLNEIRHALERFVATGEATVIDLSTIPMMKSEIAEFETALGRGEVRAEIEAGGPSEVVETAYPGVWRVTHRSAGGMILGRYVEITTIPDILCAQAPDIRSGLVRLRARLQQSFDQEEAK